MRGLTDRQWQVLSYLREYIDEHQYPPTIREIAGRFEVSTKAAFDHVKALEKKKQIFCVGNLSRSIRIISEPLGSSDARGSDSLIEVPILGSVAAGKPLFAHENLEGHLKLDPDSLKRGEHFAVRVKGDSMQNAGILHGDIAVVQRSSAPSDGDVVVAVLGDDSVVLKRFFKEKNRVRLQSENPSYPPIYTQNIMVLGRLSKIVRNYA